MIEVKILLDQEMYPDATEEILRAVINDALGRYRSYDPKKVSIKEIKADNREFHSVGGTHETIKFTGMVLRKPNLNESILGGIAFANSVIKMEEFFESLSGETPFPSEDKKERGKSLAKVACLEFEETAMLYDFENLDFKVIVCPVMGLSTKHDSGEHQLQFKLDKYLIKSDNSVSEITESEFISI